MHTFRAYLDLKKGNEHSRILDVEAETLDEAIAAVRAKMEPIEVIGQVNQLQDEAGE